MGRHLVGLIDYDEIPVGHLELGQQLFVAGHLIEPDDQPVPVLERIARPGGLDHLAGEDVELEAELVEQLVLPLLHEAAWRDDQAPVEVTADQQLLHVQARHDRLAGARVVCQQEPERLPGKHLAVHRLDLMGQRLDAARVHRQKRVEQVGELDTACLGRQPEQVAIGVEGPRARALLEVQAMLGVPVQKLFPGHAGLGAVRERQRRVTVPLDLHDRHDPVRQHATYPRAGCQLLQPCRHPVVLRPFPWGVGSTRPGCRCPAQ